VLVVSTSNLAQAIDSAFVDRADIVQYIDLPAPEAIYVILRSCLLELVTKSVVGPAVRRLFCVLMRGPCLKNL